MASSVIDEDIEQVWGEDVADNALWLGAAIALGIDPLLTHKNTNKDLRLWYRKYNAYQDAWAKLQKLRSQGKWPHKILKTELVNLFGKSAYWNSHILKGNIVTVLM